MNTIQKGGVLSVFGALALGLAFNSPAVATQEHVTICHATGSESNPFVTISPSAAGVFNGHLGSDHQGGEDIIPPFEWKGQTYSQNWPSGEATFNNGCESETSEPESPEPETPEPSTEVDPPTEEETTDIGEPPSMIPPATASINPNGHPNGHSKSSPSVPLHIASGK